MTLAEQAAHCRLKERDYLSCRAELRASIVEARKAGMSARAIAEAVGVTVTRINFILGQDPTR
jgi:hypothetical protein